jgi:flagellar protein FliS
MNATAINAYVKAEIDSSVTAADPHQLIVLLYQGALLAISAARSQMLHKDLDKDVTAIAAKGKSISHAILIIESGLRASLDKNAGGGLAQNLSDLYEYMAERLLVANLKNDVVALDEVSGLLADLKGAWEEIRPATTQPAQQKTTPRPQSPPVKPAALTYGRV